LLASGKSVGEIKRQLDAGNLFIKREILEIAKPAYAGLIQIRRGKWVKSMFYEPIVSVEVLSPGNP
jgi:hypothetical protein